MLAAALWASPALTQSQDATPVNVFRSGKGGYDTYRIPALLATKRSTLLAFCEGRRTGRGDSGDIDLLLRRSADQGRTWTPVQVVADFGPTPSATRHRCRNGVAAPSSSC